MYTIREVRNTYRVRTKGILWGEMSSLNIPKDRLSRK